MTFAERMYLMDQEAQAFNAEQEPCRCGDARCYECGPSAESEDDEPSADEPYGSWEDEAAIVDYGD